MTMLPGPITYAVVAEPAVELDGTPVDRGGEQIVIFDAIDTYDEAQQILSDLKRLQASITLTPHNFWIKVVA